MAIKAKKMSRHCLRVSNQNQLPSRPRCGVGVGLPSFYGQGLSRRTLTAGIGINSGGKSMLARRQIATVISALGITAHVLASDGYNKAKFDAKLCDPVNHHMT